MKKFESTQKILSIGNIVPCTKEPIENILFPQWDELGLLGEFYRQCVKTKEAPQGNIYDEAEFRMVLRILKGKSHNSENFADVYCWTNKKAAKYMKDARIIGSNSGKGLLTLAEVIPTISDPKEREAFATMMAGMKRDLLLVHTPAEKRECIIVTQELYDAGVTSCIDSWVEPDENGEAPETKLFVGDALIVEHKPEGDFVYRVGAEEFAETYTLD